MRRREHVVISKLQIVKARIRAAAGHELGVRAAFTNLAVFEHEKQDASPPVMAATTQEPALSPARQTSAVSSVPAVSLTRREQEVLRLLAAGASNQDIAHTLVISLDTVKKHVSNLLGKLGASSRTQAISQARARSVL